MAVHTELTSAEAADRLAIRELFDAYAHCADRRDAEGQMALFTADTRFAVYMDGEGSEATYVLDGREALAPVFADLNRYEATTHFNGQSTVTIDGDTATGESYTIAHHVSREAGGRKIMIASLRYLDTFREDQSELVLRRAKSHCRLERDATPYRADVGLNGYLRMRASEPIPVPPHPAQIRRPTTTKRPLVDRAQRRTR
jgi:hypothetical protein